MAMGTVAHLKALRRETVEPFGAADMSTMETLEALHAKEQLDQLLLPVDAGLAEWPQIVLSQQDAVRFSHGNPIDDADAAATESPQPVRVYDDQQRLLGLGRIETSGRMIALRVMNL